MVLEISSEVRDAIVDETSRFPRREVCGLLFGTPHRVTAARSCRNVASDPRRTFEIDPAQLIAAHRAARTGGPQIVGCYHSHPSGAAVPSARDAAAAMADGSIWLIAAAGGLECWRAEASGAMHGRFDAIQVTYI